MEEKPRDPHAPPGNLSGLFGFGGGHVAASFSSHYRLEDETGMLGEGTIDDEALARKARELDKKEAELGVREDAYDDFRHTGEKAPAGHPAALCSIMTFEPRWPKRIGVW